VAFKSVYVLYDFCEECTNSTIIELIKESPQRLIRMHKIKIKRKRSKIKCKHGNIGNTTNAIRLVFGEDNDVKKSSG